MRHVPTALYIDTEVFMGQGLKLDSVTFTQLTNTFIKEGIRLLIPEIMERELLRHFQVRASDVTDRLLKARNLHPISLLSSIDIPSKKDLEMQCLDSMKQQWENFKKHFIVEKLPLIGCLEDVIDWYFNIDPPFSDPKKLKEFPDAFILSALEHYHKEHKANIAVISGDDDFNKACASRRYMWCFPNLGKYIEAFQPEISGKDREPEPIDPTKPITTEDLTELKAILHRGDNVTSIEIRRVFQLLQSRGSNYDYFFQNARDPIWLDHLSSQGFFQNPPEVEKTVEGNYRIPDWPPLYYLVRVYEAVPEKTLAEIEKIPDTNNFRVLDGIVGIVLKSNSAETVIKFTHRILSFIDNIHWGHDKIIELLKKPFFFDKKLSEFSASLMFKLVEFLPNAKTQQKQEALSTSAQLYREPTPRFGEWEYQQILENGIRPLTEQEPYQVTRILIDATASMIRLNTYSDDPEKSNDEDFSEIWCRHLDHPNPDDPDYQDSKEALVHTLTFACGKVYEKTPDLVDALDQTLRNQQWKVFKRLRQHLYALNPSNQTLPWIREFILEYKDYDKWDYHYEFQLMIRKACEHFGTYLLSNVERTEIFSAIRSGPPKEDFREWMGANFTEEKFQQRQRNFHRKQLYPFKNLLSGEYQSYFNELENEFKDKPVSDEDYVPISESRSGYVSYRSPLPPEELAKLTDERLLDYINDWQEIHRDKDDWLTEINIEALAGAFQSVFKNTIIIDEDRLSFWIRNYKRIERPIYIRFLIKAMQDLIKEHHFEKLEQWIEVCNWVLSSHLDIDDRKELRRSDELKDNPDWRSSRRAVIDFLDACLNKDSNTPVNARDSLARLLRFLCSQFDWRLDRNKPVILNHDDSLIEALNNNRSLALEKLVNFGFWVRRHSPNDQVLEVTEILEERFKPDTEFPLTKPEYAILGMNYARVFNLNHEWGIRHKTNFFPQGNIAYWLEAFGNYLKFNRPVKEIFVVLREDFVFALEHLDELETMKSLETKVVDNLGQHLFTYYLWEVFPLTGEKSLLERFYEKTAENHQYWVNIFNYVGHSLKNSGKSLEPNLIDRIIAFFDWRFEINEPEELQKFTYWLAAECLDPDWRLNTYLKILDVGKTKNNVYLSIELEVLNKMLASHTTQVVECFAKLTDLVDQNNSLYIQVEEAKPILKMGLNSEDSHVQKNAERARENLLRVGRFDFLDITSE